MHYLSIDKTLRVPVYNQLKQSFAQAIQEGVLKDGQQLPTEEEVCKAFDLSHFIIRHAYDDLAEEGLVKRIKGKGTFVASRPHYVASLMKLSALDKSIIMRGQSLTRNLQLTQIIQDDPQAYLALNLETNDNCFKIRSITLAQGYPLYQQVWYIPEAVFPKITRKLNSSPRWLDSINQVQKIQQIKNYYTASIANKTDAANLEIEEDSAIFMVRSHLFNTQNHCVGFVITTYPGSTTTFEVSL